VLGDDGSVAYSAKPGFEGTDSFGYTLAGDMASSAAKVTIDVPAPQPAAPQPPAGPGPGPGPGPITTLAPIKITKLSLSYKGVKLNVAYTLSGAANATVRVEKRAGKRWKAFGKKATAKAKKGTNKLKFKLKKPGKYRVTVVVKDARGQTATRRLTVTIRSKR